MKKLLPAIITVLLLLTCQNNIGTSDETVVRTGAVIFEQDGKTPATGAVVKVFKSNATDGQYVSRQTTGSDGRYSLKGLDAGSYNIWAEKDSLVAFQDSVFVADSQAMVKDDTLKCPSTLTGMVGVQPQHDPRSVTIQVVGTDKYFKNTDGNGRFIMEGMAGGTYTLLLRSTLPEYTPTACKITVKPCSSDTLKEPLWLIYTGIPVVTGMASSYDSVSGIVHLQWNKTSYRNFQEYVIYRDVYSSVTLSTDPFAVSTDTVFTDPIFNRNVPAGTFSVTDPNDYHYKYRVAVRNNSGASGETFKYVDVVAASLTKVIPGFTFASYQPLKGFFNDTASINDTIRFSVQIVDPTRNLRSVSWTDLSTGTIVRNLMLDTASKNAFDTCRFSWNTIGTKLLECTVADMGGAVWKDTVRMTMVTDMPVVVVTSSLPVVTMKDTFILHLSATDRFGQIAKIEWDIGNKGVFSVGSAMDTVIVAPNLMTNSFLCIVRVSDDDGNRVTDTTVIAISGSMADVDGNVYHTIKIGTQEWMAENLRVTNYNDGTPIPFDSSAISWYYSTTPKFCYCGNTSHANLVKSYGTLYNWYAIDPANPKKVAPVGWHVPTDTEWSIMENYLITNGYNYDGTTTGNKIAKSLAAKTDWNPYVTVGAIGCVLSSNNSSGFNAVPGGYTVDAIFDGFGYLCAWWSITEDNTTLAWQRYIRYDYDNIVKENAKKCYGFSVRLVRN